MSDVTKAERLNALHTELRAAVEAEAIYAKVLFTARETRDMAEQAIAAHIGPWSTAHNKSLEIVAEMVRVLAGTEE